MWMMRLVGDELQESDEICNKCASVLLRDALLFWSGPYKDGGTVPDMEFSDNSRALFDYMLQEGMNERWELIWLDILL